MLPESKQYSQSQICDFLLREAWGTVGERESGSNMVGSTSNSPARFPFSEPQFIHLQPESEVILMIHKVPSDIY